MKKITNDQEVNVFSQVRIGRTPEGLVLEVLTVIALLALILLGIYGRVKASIDWGDFLIAVGLAVVVSGFYMYHSYHPSKEDIPLPITNQWQVYELARLSHYFAFCMATFFLVVMISIVFDIARWALFVPVGLLFLVVVYFGWRIYRLGRCGEQAVDETVKDRQMEQMASFLTFLIPNLLLKWLTDWSLWVIIPISVVFSSLVYVGLKKFYRP